MLKKCLCRVSAIAFAAACPSLAWAEPTLDHVLAGASVTGSGACSQVEVRFNYPVNVEDTLPPEKGTDIAVHVQVLGTTQTPDSPPLAKEAASVAPGNAAHLSAVVFDPANIHAPVVHIVFAEPMAFKIKRDDDNRHLLMSVAAPGAAGKCLDLKATIENDSGKTDLAKAPDSSVSPQEVAPGRDAPSALAEGKKQLAAGEYNRATGYFTKAVAMGSGDVKKEAQEMVGLSRERGGQLAFAKAEYEAYLKQYPGGADAARVRERLNGVVAAMNGQAEKQFALRQTQLPPQPMAPTHPAAQQVSNTKAKTAFKGASLADASAGIVPPQQPASVQVAGPGIQVSNLGLKSSMSETPVDPHAWVWSKNGSVSQYYYRDDNFTPTVPFSSALDNHRTVNNIILSTADGFARAENDLYAFEVRASLYDQQGLGDQAGISEYDASTLYLDAEMKQQKLRAKVGRQSKSTGGVFGRFDGANLSWEVMTGAKVQAVAGSPVYSRWTAPFSTDRYFYGASLDYASPNKQWASAIYAIEQNVGDIVDRRAVGGELRFNGKKGSAYAAADYDLFFTELNNAYLSGTWLPRDGTTIYATAQYMKTPFLLTSNALLGQSASMSLQDLRNALGIDDLTQCAKDRTATSQMVNAGVTQQLSEKWSGSIDSNIGYLTGTPDTLACSSAHTLEFGTPSPGFNVYLSSYLSGTGIFRGNDSISGGLAYGTSPAMDSYIGFMSYRYPISQTMWVMPRVNVNVMNSKSNGGMTYRVTPGFKFNYRINKSWTLEAELGASWQDQVSSSGSAQMLDVMAMAGYRYEF